MPALIVDSPQKDTPVALAALRTIDFSRLMDRNPVEMTKLILACQEVGFFYLNLNSPGCEGLLSNLENVTEHMKQWFNQDRITKMKTVTVSNSHGYVLLFKVECFSY